MLTKTTRNEISYSGREAFRLALPGGFLDSEAANDGVQRIPKARPGRLSRRFARDRRDLSAASGGWRIRTW